MSYINIDECKKWLQESLTEERYEHSLGTAEMASALAVRFGLDPELAYFCGLVHDCAKCLPKEDLQNILIPHLEDLCEGEFDNSKALHAPASAVIIREKYNCNSEICDSVRWHTLGKKNMTLLEKIVFLADKIETRTREEELTEPIRRALEEEKGLDKALLICYKNTIKSLVDRNLKICVNTIEVYNELLNNLD